MIDFYNFELPRPKPNKKHYMLKKPEILQLVCEFLTDEELVSFTMVS